MFEKESNGMSEDERTDFVIALKSKMCLENGKVTDADVYFQGVKDGYNKANEWHYVKDGDLPKHEVNVLVLYNVQCIDIAHYNYDYKEWHFADSIVRDVIAWKEIVLPKESE